MSAMKLTNSRLLRRETSRFADGFGFFPIHAMPVVYLTSLDAFSAAFGSLNRIYRHLLQRIPELSTKSSLQERTGGLSNFP
jgi:hypothetical protein